MSNPSNKKTTTIHEVLLALFPGAKKKTLEQKVKHGSVLIGNEKVLNLKQTVNDPAQVRVLSKGGAMARTGDFVFENKQFLIVNKPPGMSTTQNSKDFLHTATTHFAEKSHLSKLYPVHRLDRDTSGLLVFAKNPRAKERIQANWEHVQKYYLAVVEGEVHDETGRIDLWLKEDKNHKMIPAKDGEREAKACSSQYTKIRTHKGRTLLEIKLITGRKNQIRAHLSAIGHPILGDSKYGASVRFGRGLALHAYKLQLPEYITPKIILVTPPSPFGPYLGKWTVAESDFREETP